MKKILLFVAALVCSVTMVFAQDTRIVIDECEFTTSPIDPRDMIKAGDTWNGTLRHAIVAKFTAPDGAVYYLPQEMLDVQVLNGSTWKYLDSGTELNATDSYHVLLQIRIDGANGELYRLPDNTADLTVKVNGVAWTVKSTDVYSTYSFALAYGDAFQLDPRAIINECQVTTASGDYRDLIQWGEVWNDASRTKLRSQLQKETGAVWYITQYDISVEMWNGLDWTQIKFADNHTFSEANIYRYKFQVRIEDTGHRFPYKKDDIQLLVDGARWETTNPFISAGYSFFFAYSPNFVVFSNVQVVDNGILYNINREFPDAMVMPYYDEVTFESFYKDTVVIPETVTYESVDYPVTSLYAYAFAESAELKAVDIPASVTNIYAGAFAECQNMNFIICRRATPPTLAADVFLNVNAGGAIQLYVPDGQEDTYKDADDQWKDFDIRSITVYEKQQVAKGYAQEAAGLLADCIDVLTEDERAELEAVRTEALNAQYNLDIDELNAALAKISTDLANAKTNAIKAAKAHVQGDNGLTGDWVKLIYAAKNALGLDDDNVFIKQMDSHAIAAALSVQGDKTLWQVNAAFVNYRDIRNSDINDLVGAAQGWGLEKLNDLLVGDEKTDPEFLDVIAPFQAQIMNLAWVFDKDVETNLTEIFAAANLIADNADAAVKAKRAATGIDEVSGQQSEVRKVFRNGQVYIIREGKTMNVLGAEVK